MLYLLHITEPFLVVEPCLFGGTCTNTRGSFTCACPADRRGHRCQYQILCIDDSLCDDNETCVETLANSDGYVCDSTPVDMSLRVTLSDGRSTDDLSEAVYNLVSIFKIMNLRILLTLPLLRMTSLIILTEEPLNARQQIQMISVNLGFFLPICLPLSNKYGLVLMEQLLLAWKRYN